MIIGLSLKELKQIATLDRLKRGEITQVAAAKIMNMSKRWVREKLKRYIKQGEKSLAHGNRGKPGRKWLTPERECLIIKLFEDETKFAEFGPTFAAQKLEEIYKIKVSKETLRRSLIKKGYWKEKRRKIKHKEQRERKEHFGEMLQLDGCFHAWLEKRGQKYTLINFVDDATSKIPFMAIVDRESCEGVMKVFKRYIELNGIPKQLYVDYGSTFSVNTNNPDRDKKTQFERACKELGVIIIHANSPEAKGRVERSHETHQDRLVKEFRLANISTVEDANEFILNKYLPRYNAMFSVPASKKGDVHMPLGEINLDKILCLKERRKVQNDFTVLYKTRILQLTKVQKAVIRPKEIIDILENFDGSLKLYIRGIRLNHLELKKRPEKPKEAIIVKDIIYRKPAASHPWRQYSCTCSGPDTCETKCGKTRVIKRIKC